MNQKYFCQRSLIKCLNFCLNMKNMKEFKSFGASLENECMPTIKLKRGTW